MRRVRAHSSLLVLMALALVLMLARSAGAADVPFGVQQPITTAAGYALSVFAGDVDGDVADIFVLQRVVAGRPATVENTCEAYTGP